MDVSQFDRKPARKKFDKGQTGRNLGPLRNEIRREVSLFHAFGTSQSKGGPSVDPTVVLTEKDATKFVGKMSMELSLPFFFSFSLFFCYFYCLSPVIACCSLSLSPFLFFFLFFCVFSHCVLRANLKKKSKLFLEK